MRGGVLFYLSRYAVRAVRTLLLLGLWKVILESHPETTPVQLEQVLRYTLLAAVFWQQIDVQTSASNTFWEGTASSRYLRPLSVFGQYCAETAGKWLPGLVIFSLPLLLISPLLGVDLPLQGNAIPAWFLLSLAAGIACGFALDFILTGCMVFLGNAHYIAVQIRNALTLLLSGALIPLALLPFGIGRALEWLPFASMANAPLSIYTGLADNVPFTVLLQLGWAIVLWLLAALIWRLNRQKLVVFGG